MVGCEPTPRFRVFGSERYCSLREVFMISCLRGLIQGFGIHEVINASSRHKSHQNTCHTECNMMIEFVNFVLKAHATHRPGQPTYMFCCASHPSSEMTLLVNHPADSLISEECFKHLRCVCKRPVTKRFSEYATISVQTSCRLII